jgi:hypothetical protein
VSITLPEARRSRVPAAFAVLGILAALTAGGALYYNDVYRTSAGNSPETVVGKFLTAVFATPPDLAGVGAAVCDSWDPASAVKHVTSQIPADAKAGWKDIQRMTTDTGSVVVEATITLTPFADQDPSDFEGWTFNLVDQKGWRVCEARPIV